MGVSADLEEEVACELLIVVDVIMLLLFVTSAGDMSTADDDGRFESFTKLMGPTDEEEAARCTCCLRGRSLIC